MSSKKVIAVKDKNVTIVPSLSFKG